MPSSNRFQPAETLAFGTEEIIDAVLEEVDDNAPVYGCAAAIRLLFFRSTSTRVRTVGSHYCWTLESGIGIDGRLAPAIYVVEIVAFGKQNSSDDVKDAELFPATKHPAPHTGSLLCRSCQANGSNGSLFRAEDDAFDSGAMVNMRSDRTGGSIADSQHLLDRLQSASGICQIVFRSQR